MALPTGPYQGQDLTQYQAGNKFLPRQFYSLDFPKTPPPSVANTPTGITNTQAAGSYMGYPSYEAWLLAQGGGGGNGGGRDDNITNTYNVNQNLGSTNITDYEAEAYDVGPTWAGSWARAKDAYSKLPTPMKLLRKGIRHWKERREIKKEQERIAEDRTGIGDHDRGTFEGPHPDAPILTPEQGGWHPGVGGNGGGGFSGAGAGAGSTGPPGRNYNIGGRIGLRPGGIVDAGKQYYGKEDWEKQQINQYGVSYPEFLANQGWPPLKQMDATQIAAAADAWKAWRQSQADGGIARLL